MFNLHHRSNPVVQEKGDSFRDTLALTVRGDGVDIPPFTIVHTYKNASYSSGRRCKTNEDPIKGMNIPRMIDYIDHIAQYVTEPSLLIMDRLSSHTSGVVRQHILKKKTSTGEELFIPIFLPAKTAFLISPLDMGAISAFKSNFHKLDRGTVTLKLRAIHEAWYQVSNQALVNIFQNCGLIGSEAIGALRQRFMKSVGHLIPPELEYYKTFYDAWISESIDVPGAKLHRGVQLARPSQLPEGHLDGIYWANFGGKK